MTPSKLNELAAVRVMGWRVTEGAWVKWYSSDDGRKTHSPDWNPATDIADAWRLVEKVAATNPNGCWQLTRRFDGVWRCEFFDGKLRVAAHNKTAPLAITLAALRAVGVEESELNSKDND